LPCDIAAQYPRYGPGEDLDSELPETTVVMQEMGHTDPALAQAIYANAMPRDEGENERLRALVEGVEMPSPVPRAALR
jgi:hypothetical protein